MKTKTVDILKFLINPFDKIAGWKAFVIGAMIVSVTVFIGYMSKVFFPALIDVKMSSMLTFGEAWLAQAISLFSTVLITYLAALIFAKNVRFQDILGTVTLSRYPYIFVALLGFIVSPFSDNELMSSILNGTFNPADYAGMIVFALISLVFSLWSLILLYNAFRVSTGIRSPKSILIFIGIVILSEILPFAIFYLFNKL